MRSAFVVLNPVAGNSDPGLIRNALERHLGGQGWTYDVHETTGRKRIAQVVRSALEQRFDAVIAAGGDGTVSGVAGGLVHTGVPLGIIPAGTGNALARDLGISLDLEEALRLLVDEQRTTAIDIDAMQVGDRFMILNLGVGISALAVRATERSHKRRFGRIAYVWAGLREFFGFQPRRFNVTVDGRSNLFRASEIMVLNSGGLGSPHLNWGPRVRPDDGRLDVRIVRARTALDYLRLGRNFLLGQQKRDPSLQSLSAERRIAIRADRPLPVQGDGDLIGQTPIQVKVVPGAVRVIAPVAVEHRQPGAEGD
jgi:YegS/Rv2252/BmrU family lipid kinase